MDDDIRPSEPPNMAWLLTFADLVSLLITFFVLLFSMKNVDQEVWEAVKGSFDGVFTVNKPVLHVAPDQDASIGRIALASADNLDYIQSILALRFRDNDILQQARLHRDVEKDILTVALPTTLLFAPGSATLKPQGTEAMAALADQLRFLDNRIEIAGHTDPSPIATADYPSNWELAMMRAVRVVTMLNDMGLEQNIPAVSYGDSRFPLVAPLEALDARYIKARRVEVIIHGKQ